MLYDASYPAVAPDMWEFPIDKVELSSEAKSKLSGDARPPKADSTHSHPQRKRIRVGARPLVNSRNDSIGLDPALDRLRARTNLLQCLQVRCESSWSMMMKR
jgi:hypothetical protein